MNVSNALKVSGFFGLLLVSLLGCSSEAEQFSPEQVINNALKEKADPSSYYAESEWIFSFAGEEPEKMINKEWHSEDGKVRMEVENEDGSNLNISINDGKTFTMYSEESKEAFVSDDSELQDLNQLSPKDQAMNLLEWITETHELTSEGEKEIIGRTAYHLKAKANEDGQLLGDQEFWIDKETWIVLKTITSGEDRSETTYTKLDFDMNIPEDTFTLDLPDDVTVQNLEDIYETTEVTLSEAVEALGTPFNYLVEEDDMAIETIEVSELGGDEIERKEINITYTKDDLPLFTMGIFEGEVELSEDDQLPGDELVTVRGLDGYFIDMDEFRLLFWEEDGLHYSLIFDNPDFSLEDFQKLAETMEVAE